MRSEADVGSTRLVHQARDAVAAGGRLPDWAARAVGRSLPRAVVDSWARSRRFGVDPERNLPPLRLTGDQLVAARQAHPLGSVLPLIRDLLVDEVSDDGLIVAISDADGTLLWVEGDRAVRGRAEGMGFMPGAGWDEAHAGTNAPGLALALDRRARVTAAEHWVRTVRPWSCAASPVHDPADGRLIGALDVTGNVRRAADPGVMALIAATVAAAERELLLHRLRQQRSAPPRPPGGAGTRLTVLRPGPVLTVDGQPRPITQRHAELLLLLAEHPDGRSAEELAADLDERPLDPVTVRAEMSRLRRVLGPVMVSSRPYRLAEPLDTDVAEVRRLLARGDHAGVLDLWSGHLLPRSVAPAVVALRERLRAEVRAGLLRRGDPMLLLRWAEGPAGEDDVELWEACRRLLPPGPARDRATARAELLDRELAAR
ncbi:MAG: phytochrome sensor protein [Frankia sp.]|nr:phytochrome sensor protein [Frankia sp.]